MCLIPLFVYMFKYCAAFNYWQSCRIRHQPLCRRVKNHSPNHSDLGSRSAVLKDGIHVAEQSVTR